MSTQEKLIQDIQEQISDFNPMEIEELDIIITGLEKITSNLKETRSKWLTEKNL